MQEDVHASTALNLDDSSWGRAFGDEVEDLLTSLAADGTPLVTAQFRRSLRDFELRAADGRGLLFRECLQVSFHRPLGDQPLTIGSWWTDEPSPILLTLGPQVRFLFKHVVFELGEGLLRVACRQVELLEPPTPALSATASV